MKILQVVPGMSPRYGGPSVALADMTRLLTKHGIETTLMTTNMDPTGRLDAPVGKVVEQRGARMLYFNVWPHGRYAFSASLAKALLQSVRSYDVVHVHWLYSFSSLAAAMVAVKMRVPYVFQPNGSLDPFLMRKHRDVKRIYNVLLGNYIIRHASAIIFTSAGERRLAGLKPMPASSHVIPVGLDWAEYANLPREGELRSKIPDIRDRQVVLFLGRISRQKGLDLLIPAFSIVVSEQPETHLLIIGPDGEGYGSEVKQLVVDACLEENVTFVGPVEQSLKLAAYAGSDVFVLPSYAENFGATVVEALACKCPVVVSDRVNICDEIAGAEAGVVVELRAESIAEGILRLLQDQTLAGRMGENGRQLVQQEYTWETVLRKLIPIYQGVAQSG